MPWATIRESLADLENPLVSEFRGRGGRCLGFFCSYVPEELLNVPGLASFRMRSVAVTGSETADSLLGACNCSYTKFCLEAALEGAYDFLDGFVFVPGCDHLRRLYDNWAHYLKPGFLALLDAPHLRDADARQWYREEISHLWERLTRHFELPADPDLLREGIRRTNRSRMLLEALQERRLENPPLLTGREMQEISLFAASTPKETANPVLEKLLLSLQGRDPLPAHRARLLLVGSHLDDPAFIGLLENTGALIVQDAYCGGLRDQLGFVEESADEDPFAAIAARYLDRLSCPRMYEDYPRRLERVLRLAARARVDGVILENLKFCETWGIDGNVLLEDLRRQGLPVLRLEREYRLSGEGQIRTRVQAFLESMGK